MSRSALGDWRETPQGRALKALFEAHRLWRAERLPVDDREAIQWGDATIDYEVLKAGLAGSGRRYVSPAPYPGLRSFTPQEGGVFFGRRSDVEAVRDRLKAHRVVMVLGGSGSGKSSLVRAGLLPHLNSVGRIGGRGGTWYWAEFRPQQAPFANLVEALVEHVVAPLVRVIARRAEAEPDLSGQLSDLGLAVDASPSAMRSWVAGPVATADDDDARLAALLDFVDHRLERLDDLATGGVGAGKPNLLLLVDQFEEIFREGINKQQKRQNEQLLNILTKLEATLRKPPWSTGGLFVALTMRSEELHRCGEYDGLAQIVNRSVFLLELLDPERTADQLTLHDAIVKPARRAFRSYGLEFDEKDRDSPFAPGVPDWLVDGASKQWGKLEHRPDQLPLLQHALRAMWDCAVSRWAKEGPKVIHDQGGKIVLNKDGLAKTGFQIQGADLPGDDLKTPYPDLDRCLSARADEAAAEARGRFRNYKTSGRPKRLTAKGCPEGEVALRAAFSALARQDDRGNRARRFASLDDMLPFVRNNAKLRRLEALDVRLGRALEPLIFHGYLTGGGKRPYDISHEALIRNWTRCSRWLGDNEDVVRALRRILDDVDPDAFERLDDQGVIADSIPAAFVEQVGFIGDDNKIPTSWAIDQIVFLLRAAAARRLRWIPGANAGRAEAAGVLVRIQNIAANSRKARESLRLEKVLSEERAQKIEELRVSTERALAAEAEAVAQAKQAQASEKKASSRTRWMTISAGVASLLLIASVVLLVGANTARSQAETARRDARRSEAVALRTLAITQIETPPAADWPQSIKLGILKAASPPDDKKRSGARRQRSKMVEEQWDRIARLQLGGYYWLVNPTNDHRSVQGARCWTNAGPEWRPDGPTDRTLEGFPSSTRNLTLAGRNGSLLLEVTSSAGKPQGKPVDLLHQAPLPPLGEHARLCLSRDASIMTLETQGNSVPNIYELNLMNCAGQCEVALNQIKPSLAKPISQRRSNGKLAPKQPANPGGFSRVTSIDSTSALDDQVSIKFDAGGRAEKPQGYVANFYRRWATAARTEAADLSRGVCRESRPPDGRRIWSCPSLERGREVTVTMYLGRAGAPEPGQGQLVRMQADLGAMRTDTAPLRLATFAGPPDIESVALIKGPTLVLRDRAGDFWSVKLNERWLRDKVIELGDSANLPDTVFKLVQDFSKKENRNLLTSGAKK